MEGEQVQGLEPELEPEPGLGLEPEQVREQALQGAEI